MLFEACALTKRGKYDDCPLYVFFRRISPTVLLCLCYEQHGQEGIKLEVILACRSFGYSVKLTASFTCSSVEVRAACRWRDEAYSAIALSHNLNRSSFNVVSSVLHVLL